MRKFHSGSFSASLVKNQLEAKLRKVLVAASYPADKLAQYDKEPKVYIELDGAPTIELFVQDSRLFLYTQFEGVVEEVIEKIATDLLPILIENCEYVETGQLILKKQEQGYSLHGLLDISCLDEEYRLAAAIERFYQQQAKINAAIMKGI